MGRLRDKMEGDLRLCGLSENTRKAYLRCVAKFSRHYGKSPSKLGRAEIRDYLLHLIEGRKCSTLTYNVYASIRSTVWYVQVTPAVLRKVISPADRLHKTVAPSGTSPRDTAAEGHDDVTRHDVTRRVS